MLLSAPAEIERVLTNSHDFVKHYALRFLQPILGRGLVTSEGELWRRQRRLIQPEFARQRIAAYAEPVVRHALELAERWRPGTTTRLHADMGRLAMKIAAEAFLNVRLEAEVGPVARAIDVFTRDFDRRLRSALPPPVWLPTPRNLQLLVHVRRLGRILQRAIEERQRGRGLGEDVLSRLVRIQAAEGRDALPDRQIRDEVVTLFLAGHETTAVALTWTWCLLARHPAVLERMLAEQDAVLGGRPPEAADLPRLPYTERIVLESLRLYPPAFVIGREALRDCEIGGYRVPAGTAVLMSAWVVHRDGRFFEEPERFEPDRWEGLQPGSLARCPWFPFGGGSRSCIGSAFARMEIALVLATLAPRWRIEPVDGELPAPWPAVTLRPSRDPEARLELR